MSEALADEGIAAILADIRENAEQETATHRDDDCPPDASCVAHEALRMANALEEVLKLHVRRDTPVKTHILCRDHSALAHHSGRMPREAAAICPECTVTEKYVCQHCRHECPDEDQWPCPTVQAISRILLDE